jgi:hypothetical protein
MPKIIVETSNCFTDWLLVVLCMNPELTIARALFLEAYQMGKIEGIKGEGVKKE